MKLCRASSSIVRCSLISILFGFTLSGLAQGNPAKLTAYWNFDDASSTNTLDLIHGIVGQLREGAIYTDAGGGRTGTGADRSVDFGETAQRQMVRVPNVEWLNQLTRSGDVITVSFWQKLRSTGASYAFWAVTPTRERAISAHAPWSDNVVYWDMGGAGAGTRVSINSTEFEAEFSWTNWNHIVLVKNEFINQIWVNGVFRAEGDASVPLVSDIVDFAIGNHPTTAPTATVGAIKGWIDDFAIFAGALDEAQITALFGGASPTTLDPDTDADGMPDWWEDKYGLNAGSASDAAENGDNDGLANLQEFQRLTDPTVADTDGDGFNDGAESNTGVWVSDTDTGTDPIRQDTDEDGLLDGAENNSGTFVSLTDAGSNPLLKDTDGDNFTDYAEAALGGDPVDETITALKPGQVNLLAWWNFDDATVPDTSLDQVHGFKGMLLNNALFSEPGTGRSSSATDRALDLGFDVGELMNVENPRWLSALSPGNSVTISFWQKWHTEGSVANNTFWADSTRTFNAPPVLNAHVPWTDRTVYWDTTVSAAPEGRISKVLPAEFYLLDWHHYAFIKNGNAKQIYIDGVLFHSGSNTGPLPPEVHRLMVGGHVGTPLPRNSMNGLIDDFAIFAKALSATEVASLASGSSPGALAADTDADGMPDLWEIGSGLNKDVADAEEDADSDGLTNLQEYLAGTLPNNEDTDGDSLRDGAETNTGTWVSAADTGTNPLIPDTDGDNLPDGAESNTGTYVSATDTGTSPLSTDSDGDLFLDFVEFQLESDPASASSTPITPGTVNLLAFWNFNTADDFTETRDVVHGFPGTFPFDVYYTFDGDGRSGMAGDTAMLFPGIAGSVVKIPAAQFMGAVGPGNEMTISFWQRHSFIPPAGSATYWVDSGNASLPRFSLAHVPWSDGTIYFDAGGNSVGGQDRISKSMLATNPDFDWTAWHHVALVRKGTTQQIWVNGTNFHEGVVTAPLQSQATTMGIGGQFSGGNPFSGAIDDFAVFGSALDPVQITALAAGASPQSLPSGSFEITSATFVGGAFTITFQSSSDENFKVFRSTNLTDWGNSIADVAASTTGSTTSFTDNSPPAGAGAVFYRIQR